MLMTGWYRSYFMYDGAQPWKFIYCSQAAIIYFFYSFSVSLFLCLFLCFFVSFFLFSRFLFPLFILVPSIVGISFYRLSLKCYCILYLVGVYAYCIHNMINIALFLKANLYFSFLLYIFFNLRFSFYFLCLTLYTMKLSLLNPTLNVCSPLFRSCNVQVCRCRNW